MDELAIDLQDILGVLELYGDQIDLGQLYECIKAELERVKVGKRSVPLTMAQIMFMRRFVEFFEQTYGSWKGIGPDEPVTIVPPGMVHITVYERTS